MNTKTPFVIETMEIEKDEELKYYSSVLEKVISHFKLKEIDSHDVRFEDSFDVYHQRTKALTSSLKTKDAGQILLGWKNFKKISNKSSEYNKNLPFVLEVINRYFLEKGVDKKIVIYQIDEKLEVHELTEKINVERLVKNYDTYFFSPKFKYDIIYNTVRHYEDRDLFRRLPIEVIERGKELNRSNSLYCLQDLLWDFKDLVITCCPRESGEDYEGVLKDFIRGTHGELRISNFKKDLVEDERCSISFEVNDKPFVTKTSLPKDFSLGLIYQLNSFLSDEFNRSFYIWNWERNPWEQKTFIYLSNGTYKNYFNRMNEKEITPLPDYIVSFYDKNR